MDNNKVAALLRTVGLRTAKGQEFLRKVLAKDPALALRAVAQVLKNGALIEKRMPVDAGILTQDLLAVAEASARDLARNYMAGGSPLVTFFPPEVLAKTILDEWRIGFAAPCGVSGTLGSLPEEELNFRLTAATQALEKLLRKIAEDQGTPGSVSLQGEDLEWICSRITRAVVGWFDTPNHTNHTNIHGVEPKEGPP